MEPNNQWHLSSHPNGIIAGCSQNQEWLLPWWWMNLRLHNLHPITFVNFGDMSETALRWCQLRGEVKTLDIPDSLMETKEKVDAKHKLIWESIHADVWQMRLAWFKKPFALLQSSYKRALWLDLDCQVRGPLDPLFEKCENEGGIAMKREETILQELDFKRGLLLPGEKTYNAGVIAFKHGSPIIQEWAKQALTHNHLFMGDQQLLSRLVFTQKTPLSILPDIYNWRMDQGPNEEAVILHWLGDYKNYIQEEIQLLKKHFYTDLTLDSTIESNGIQPS